MTAQVGQRLVAAGLAAFLAFISIPKAGSQQVVDLELVLAIDTSGSVDPWEFNLQILGLAEAFRDPEVQAAIAGSTPNGIAVAVVQWSGPTEQALATPWMLVSDRLSAELLATGIEVMGRQFMGRTGIAGALAYALRMLTNNGFVGHRRVIDLSGDGRSNDPHDPAAVRDAAVAAGITVNGLAILTDVPDLDSFYRAHVVGGPDAFLMIAKDYQDFVHAIRRKLLREIRGTPIGAMPLPDARPQTLGRRLPAASR